MGIRSKILAPVVMGFLTLTTVMSMFWGPALLEREQNRMIKHANSLIEMLAPSLTDSLLAGDLAEVYSLLNYTLEEHQGSIEQIVLLDAEGKRLFPFQEPPVLSGKYYVHTQLPLAWEYTELGVLRVVFDIEKEILLEQGEINKLEIFTLLVFAVIALFSAVWFNATIRRPVMKLQSAAARLAAGDFNVTLNEKKNRSKDELAMLTNSFIEMRDNLAVAYDNLNEAAHTASQNEIRQRTILEHITDGIIVLDDQQRISAANPAVQRIFLYRAHDIIGRKLSSFVIDDFDLDEVLKVTADVDGGRLDTVGLKKDGSRFSLEISASKVSFGEGEMYIVIVRDISERKRVERMKSEFVSTVSHELRTPLTSLRAALQLIKGGVAGELAPSMQNLIDLSARNSDRLLFLVNDILDMQKIESGEMEFHMVEVGVADTMRQAVEDNAGYAKKYQVTFKICDLDDQAKIWADPHRLMQVVGNLLSNAAKFSPKGGTVKIGVERGEGEVLLYVRDYGCGIPEDFIPRLFDKFTQADSSDTRGAEGTGLGLAITRALVEKQGGSISLTSTLGEGTTFLLHFPEYRPALPAAKH